MGKTAVFVITILNSLLNNNSTEQMINTCLVLTLTRELALQIKGEFERFLKSTPKFKVYGVWGGESISEQIKDLKEIKPQIIVGTAGRVLSLTKKKVLVWKNLNMFVLDECDKMLGALGIHI